MFIVIVKYWFNFTKPIIVKNKNEGEVFDEENIFLINDYYAYTSMGLLRVPAIGWALASRD